MDEEDVMENLILQLLKGSPGKAFSHKEVSKKVDRHQYREDPHWARPILNRLVTQNQISKNRDGHYFVPKERY
jgi:hypothetical protein